MSKGRMRETLETMGIEFEEDEDDKKDLRGGRRGLTG